MNKPNIVFVFGDQWRQQATGFAGNSNVKTPNLDALAQESVNFTHAVSGCPVCSPYRGSLLTGQYPLTHGVFVNDVWLQPKGPSLAEAFSAAGYDTAYIGKWHLDGHGRSNYIPPERRLGFNYWKVLECTHDYNHSAYYAGNCPEKLEWDGYDALAQTKDVENYLRRHNPERPFLLVLSWGPPHNPYETAPAEFQQLYSPDTIQVRPNVPADIAPEAREWLAGYYAHCSALDACMGQLLNTLEKTGQAENTILVFTSDHGDMLGSHGQERKQRPWEESIRVPFLLRGPNLPNWQPRETDAMIDAPDIMPTLLGLCGIPTPDSVEGQDFSEHITGGPDPTDGAALLMCPHPFGEWSRTATDGRAYRGLRTKRYTYVRDRQAPWLLYDNEADPYQHHNLINDPEAAAIRDQLEQQLRDKLAQRGDAFLDGMDYIRQWGYPVDESGTVPYTK